MHNHYYFAYGSNLNLRQMTERCPGHRIVGRARLLEHALAFTGHSERWGGAVATVAPVPAAAVDGVVYAITDEHVATLDGFEEHPHVYVRQPIHVQMLGASPADDAHALPPGPLTVMTYIQPLTNALPGASGYVDVIREGYLAHGLHVRTLDMAATGTFPHQGPPHDR
jgi:gamma-glutamylcyclotransferase (GGCT)/AIG2-like uncharacterized protein YtfP